MTSPPFSAGGQNWVVWYYPNGHTAEYADDIVFQLVLDSDATDVKEKVGSAIVVKDLQPFSLNTCDYIFPRKGSTVLRPFKRAAFEVYLIDDCIQSVFDITVIVNAPDEETMGNQFVVVPPSDLHRHFRDLLESMDGADVTFRVGGEKILAHSSVLAARSSVFKAELLGTMKEKAGKPD